MKISRYAQFWLGAGLEVFSVAVLSQHGNFLLPGEAWRFTLLGFGAGLAYWLAASAYAGLPRMPGTEAGWFWAVAVVLRLAVFPCFPGDDVWRYRWEGAIQLHGFNPYQFAPDAAALVPWRDADWHRISHLNFPAIYPPLVQWLFAGLASLGNKVWLYKLVFTLADLGAAGILRRLAGSRRAAWYAWNPLAVYASAGAAHFDSLMILALLGAVRVLEARSASGEAAKLPSENQVRTDLRAVRSFFCAEHATPVDNREKVDSFGRLGDPSLPCWQEVASALLLGLAIGVKIAPAVLLPVWAFAVGRWRRVALLLPLVAAPTLAPALWYGFPAVPVFAALGRFGRDFRVNEPVWWLWEAAGLPGSAGGNGVFSAVALLVCGGLAWWFQRDWRRGLLWVWGAALLLSPVVHAWYVVWVLPLAAWRGEAARAWFVFSVSTFGYFLLWQVNPPGRSTPWMEPVWLRFLIELPPLLTLAWMEARNRLRCREAKQSC